MVVSGLTACGAASVEARHRSLVGVDDRGSPDGGVAALRELIQHAVDVKVTDAGRLDITDSAGRVTTVFLAEGSLRATGPGGTVSELLQGVHGVTFDVQGSRSLEEGELLVEHGPLRIGETPSGASRAVVLEAGRQLALGFTLPADAPDSHDSIDEIEEELVGALFEELVLRAGRIDGHGREFCHLRKEAPHTGSHADGLGLLTVELFEARAPGDPRPTGSRLASLSLPMSNLPPAAYNWFDRSRGEEVIPPEVLDPGAGSDRLWWARRPDVVLNVTPALEQVVVDLSELRTALRPGRAYTLLLGTAGDDLLAVEAVDVPTAQDSAVAMKTNRGRVWEKQPLAVWHTLLGKQSFTQTNEVLVPRLVEIHLDFAGGMSHDAVIGIECSVDARGEMTPRPALVQLEDAGRLTSVEDRLVHLFQSSTAGPVTRFSGRTLLQGAELLGLVVLEEGTVLYLDDVILRGTIVSGGVTEGGKAPCVVVDGPLNITSGKALPGTAIYLPGGEVRTAEGCTPPVQIDGDLIAHALDLDARGAIHGQVAAVGELKLGAGIGQPGLRRARMLRSPGLER